MDIERLLPIHSATLGLLEKVRVMFRNETALTLPAAKAEETITAVPRNAILYGRNMGRDLPLEDQSTYARPSGGMIYVVKTHSTQPDSSDL